MQCSTLGKKILKSKETNFYKICSPLEEEKVWFCNIESHNTFEMWIPAWCLPLCSLLPVLEALVLRLRDCILIPSQAPGGSGAELSELWQGGNRPWCAWQGADSRERHIPG